ncbi:MAG: fused MFS/spermidine synthase [Hylemonella sp.]|nr:fused MFS/spermidine synthase [Hylemonella sp.]
MPSNRNNIVALYAIFFVSGFCGLIYESIWSHYLKLLLGHAAYAQAVVLVVFVGGLALGAWLTGRLSERLRNPILLYAAAEIAVALISFAFHGIFTSISAWAVTSFMPVACSDQGLCPASWLLAAVLILPPSILLGTTFPLMSAGVLRLGAHPGRGLSLLYFLNSAGAALGVLSSGFLLIPSLGLPGTLLVAGCLNALVGLAAYRVGRGRNLPTIPSIPALELQATQASTRMNLRPLLIVAMLTGLSSFIYEVVWIRMLTMVLGAATHSFELMLSTFILGLALGAWWIRNRIDSSRRPEILLANVQIAMGILAIATLPLYIGSFETMAYTLRGLARTDEGYAFFNLTSILLSMAVMMPAAFCAGMTLPLITAMLLGRGQGEKQIGQVYGVNTLGAILGVLATVHLLIPMLGLKWSLAVAALVDVALGLYLYWHYQSKAEPAAQAQAARKWIVAAGGALAVVVLAVPVFSELSPHRLASGVFRSGSPMIGSEQQVIFQRDGKTATISVLEAKSGERSLITNGKSDGSTHPAGQKTTADDHTVVLLGALGPLHHPQARRAAVIGLGTGVTSAVLLSAEGLQTVETIEIEPQVRESAALFKPRNAAVFDDPRSRIIIDDAKAHFAKTPVRYDLVVSEPSNPWVSGVSGLFTEEFYRYVSSHLASDGHFVQWLQLYEASPAMVSSIIRAFSSVFPHFRVYTTNRADIVLVARNDKRLPEIRAGAFEQMKGIQSKLRDIGIEDESTLLAHESVSSTDIRILLDSYGTPANSDYYPFVDSVAARDRFKTAQTRDLFELGSAPVPILELEAPPPAYLERVHSATALMPPRIHELAGAWQGYRYLRGQTLAPEDFNRLSYLAGDYVLVRGWLKDCRFSPDEYLLRDSFVKVASHVNKGLRSETAQRFWRDVATRCAKSLPPVEAAWIELFAATGARDARSMRDASGKVLALDKTLTPNTREYVVLGAIASRLALGEAQQAREIMSTYGRDIPADRIGLPWFRYVGLSLQAQQAAPRPRNVSPAAQ